jgi:hypothetical protein
LIKPLTINGLDDPEAVKLPGLEVTVYDVIASPPSEAGAVKETVACALPMVAVPMVGVPGTVAPAVGETELEAPLVEPVPDALVAVTVNV